MKITGGCHCGRVTYRATVDPATAGICHCHACQRLTGSPYRVTVHARAEDVEVSGEVRTYTRLGDSGRPRHQMFCPDCGSPLFVTGAGEAAARWGIRWGSIDQRDEIAPRNQIWCEAAAPFAQDIRDLPGRDGN